MKNQLCQSCTNDVRLCHNNGMATPEQYYRSIERCLEKLPERPAYVTTQSIVANMPWLSGSKPHGRLMVIGRALRLAGWKHRHVRIEGGREHRYYPPITQ